MDDHIAEAACEILAATNDGDDLAPQHLALVQFVVNGFGGEKGRDALMALLAEVRAGYTKPAFHGIAGLTVDLAGYVFWKGIKVEHFTPGWSNTPAAKVEAQRLAVVCRRLEAADEPVTMKSVLDSDWPDQETLPAAEAVAKAAAAPDNAADTAPAVVAQHAKPALPNVVFFTVSNRIIDRVAQSETARDAILRLTREYGMHLTVMDIDTAGDLQDAQFKSAPVRITEAQWWEALEVLPPEDWQRTADGESFKMAERTSGYVTAIYVALDDGWFNFSDDCHLSHADCVARVRDWLAQEAGTEDNGPEA